jgi:hypothetical protein
MYLEFGSILGSDSKLISNLASVNEIKMLHGFVIDEVMEAYAIGHVQYSGFI